MKLKTILKVGLPILAVSALALVIALPVALTARNHHSSKNETNTKLVTTTTQDITKTTNKLETIKPEKIGNTSGVVKSQTIYGSILNSLNLKQDQVQSVNYVKTNSPSAVAKTYSTFVTQPTQQVQNQSNTWNVQVTLKSGYDWNLSLLKNENPSLFTIQGHTLTLKNIKTQFSTIGISEQELIDNKSAISEALNSIKNLANYSSGYYVQQLKEQFLDKLNSLVPGIPTAALTVKFSGVVPEPKMQPMLNNYFVVLASNAKSIISTSSTQNNEKAKENSNESIDAKHVSSSSSETSPIGSKESTSATTKNLEEYTGTSKTSTKATTKANAGATTQENGSKDTSSVSTNSHVATTSKSTEDSKSTSSSKNDSSSSGSSESKEKQSVSSQQVNDSTHKDESETSNTKVSTNKHNEESVENKSSQSEKLSSKQASSSSKETQVNTQKDKSSNQQDTSQKSSSTSNNHLIGNDSKSLTTKGEIDKQKEQTGNSSSSSKTTSVSKQNEEGATKVNQKSEQEHAQTSPHTTTSSSKQTSTHHKETGNHENQQSGSHASSSTTTSNEHNHQQTNANGNHGENLLGKQTSGSSQESKINSQKEESSKDQQSNEKGSSSGNNLSGKSDKSTTSKETIEKQQTSNSSSSSLSSKSTVNSKQENKSSAQKDQKLDKEHEQTNAHTTSSNSNQTFTQHKEAGNHENQQSGSHASSSSTSNNNNHQSSSNSKPINQNNGENKGEGEKQTIGTSSTSSSTKQGKDDEKQQTKSVHESESQNHPSSTTNKNPSSNIKQLNSNKEDKKDLDKSSIKSTPVVHQSGKSPSTTTSAPNQTAKSPTPVQTQSNLSLVTKEVELSLLPTSGYMFYQNDGASATNTNNTYKQTIDYSYIDFGNLSSQIVNFIKSQDVYLFSTWKSKNLTVINGKSQFNLPVQYTVLNPFTTSTALGNNGTYISQFVFDLGKYNFKINDLLKKLNQELISIFGNDVKYSNDLPINVSYDNKSGQLTLKITSDVLATTKDSIISGIDYLKHYSTSDLSNLSADNYKNQDIRNGLLNSMGLSELPSTISKYINIQSSNLKNTTTITLTFGETQGKQTISDGITMPELSKELQTELSKLGLGQKGIDSITYMPKTTKDGKTTNATLTIKIQDSALSKATNTTVKTTNENIKSLAAYFANANNDSFNFKEFNQTQTATLRNSKMTAIALRNSSLLKTVAIKLNLPINDIYEVRLSIGQNTSGNKTVSELKILVTLNAGLTFGSNGDINSLELPKNALINVNVTKMNVFASGQSHHSNTLIFTLTPKVNPEK